MDKTKEKKTPSYVVNQDGINILAAEDGNISYMLRQVSWNGRTERLELRKWHIAGTGEEIPGKGITFRDKTKVDEIVESLAKNDFGRTEQLLQNIHERDDFEDALVHTIGQQKVIQARNTEYEINEDEYFDPKNLI